MKSYPSPGERELRSRWRSVNRNMRFRSRNKSLVARAATTPLPKIISRESNFDSSMNSFDCADEAFVTEDDRAGGRLWLGPSQQW
jgi:hypothetical protein